MEAVTTTQEQNTNHYLRQQLHKELKTFNKNGILFPIRNNKLSPQDHYKNRSNKACRLVPKTLYHRLRTLPTHQIQDLLPHIYETITLRDIKNTGIPAWLGDTITTRKKYDRWYWKTRLTRIPFNQAAKSITPPLMTKLQHRAHEYHIKTTIERNSHLTGPPLWLLLRSLDEESH